MKSSMRNQFNPQALRSDKRFDILVKKQETEHAHALSNHNKEMQALRDTLLLACEKFEALSEKNDRELKDFKTYSICSLGVLKEKVFANETVIAAQKKSIEDLYQLITGLQDSHVTNVDMGKFRKEVGEKIKESTASHWSSFQELQTEMKEILKLIKDDFDKHRSSTENKFSSLMDIIEEKFNISKIDREGVLKEIRIYEKTIFIIEKKLENIYTLIERLNKRGELCHKPE